MKPVVRPVVRMDRLFRVMLGGAFLSLLGLIAQPYMARAQADPLQVHATEVKAIEVHHQTQQKEEKWGQQKTELKTRYRALQAEDEALQRSKALFEKQITALTAKKAEAQRRIVEMERVGKELGVHLDNVLARLEARMATDIPFLPTEREGRIKEVREVLADPDTGIAEKCRRVMEALKVETEYGHTVEVYQEIITVPDEQFSGPVMADILRVGRLALFWRTPDGDTVGHWDRTAGRWTVLDDKHRRQINDATEMALRQRTIDMVKLPLGRIAAR